MRTLGAFRKVAVVAASAALCSAVTSPGEAPPALPFSMIMEFPGMEGGVETLRIQAVLERHPELAAGPERDGMYEVAAAFRRDGSIHQSHVRFVPTAERPMARDELTALLPPEGRGVVSAMARKGEWANGGRLPADILLDGSLLPPDFDEATSATRVQQAVLQRHADLMRSPLTDKLNVLTVFMARDGSIDRDRIQTVLRKDFGNELPDYASAVHFTALGLKPEELGRMDLTTISRPVPGATAKTLSRPDGSTYTLPPEMEYLPIVYAWPRGMGAPAREPRATPPSAAGALIPIARAAAARGMGDPDYLRENKQRDVHVISEIAKRYPEIVDGPEREGYFTFVLLFRPDGTVAREGMRYATDQAQTNRDQRELRDAMRERTTGATTMQTRRKGDVLPDGRPLKANIGYMYTAVDGGAGSIRLGTGPENRNSTLRRLALQQFTDLATQPDKYKAVRPWVLFTYDGELLRKGMAFMEPADIFLAGQQLAPLMPGARFAEVEAARFGTRGEPGTTVMFVWLAADSPLPPAVN